MSFIASSTYNPATHKVVPKDAVALDQPAEDLLTLIDWFDDGKFRLGPISREFIRQVREQTKPPRIPEPGLWGVVEARTEDDSTRRKFGRIPESNEQHWSDAMAWCYCWDDLVDPVLVRDGIE